MEQFLAWSMYSVVMLMAIAFLVKGAIKQFHIHQEKKVESEL
jgi:hypothetical protein